MKCKSIISEMENDTQEYICATGECSFRKRNWENRGGQISGRGKLYNFEEEAGIAENELVELNNRKEVADKEEVASISITQEEKEKEKKGLKTK